MGMPNLRFKLPSRNWMIFFTVTGSFTAALIYDRREKRRAQQKWCDLVAHLSKETLPVEETRRKLTIFMAAPPGDGLRPSREYFKEYVKPILVAAALDYSVIEGRREGDVRAGLAKKIRKFRRQSGEPSSAEEEQGIEDIVADARKKIGVYDEPGPKGDMVIGRHTWKEYVRGLHEGWLGPLDPPPPPPAPEADGMSTDDVSPVAESTENQAASEETEKKKDEKPTKPSGPTPAYIAPADYASQSLPATFPQTLQGSAVIPFPHILGFLNTPIRIYRFLTQRYLADSVGREVAAIVLASSTRNYQDGSLDINSDDSLSPSSSFSTSDTSAIVLSSTNYEQQHLLEHEEQDWHKSVHKREESEANKEREWLDDIVLDPRIASRMQRFTLSPDDDARSERIGQGEEYILGQERPKHIPFWKRMWIEYGYGEDEETARRKPIIGNLDDE